MITISLPYSAFKYVCTITLWQVVPLLFVASEFIVAQGKIHLHSGGKKYSQGVFPLPSAISQIHLPFCISFSGGVNICCKQSLVWITALAVEMFSWDWNLFWWRHGCRVSSGWYCQIPSSPQTNPEPPSNLVKCTYICTVCQPNRKRMSFNKLLFQESHWTVILMYWQPMCCSNAAMFPESSRMCNQINKNTNIYFILFPVVQKQAWKVLGNCSYFSFKNVLWGLGVQSASDNTDP